MESRANYTIVGIFVLILTAGVILFAFWLGKYGFDEKYDYYRVYTQESVSGLSVDATVKYRGVDVGSVSDIKIDNKDYTKVEILLQVKRGTPVTKGMKAEMKYFGLTGLAYIELTGGYKNAPLLKQDKNNIPILDIKPSLYNRLESKLTVITDDISELLSKLNKLLSDENIKNLSQTIENTKDITQNIKNSNPQISQAIKDFVEIEENIKVLTQAIADTTKKIGSSSDAFKNMSDSITELTKKKLNNLIKQIGDVSSEANSLIKDVIKSVKEGDYNLKKISSPTLSKINTTIRELKMLLKDSQDMVEELKNSPSDLLYKKTEPLLGPGEKTE